MPCRRLAGEKAMAEDFKDDGPLPESMPGTGIRAYADRSPSPVPAIVAIIVALVLLVAGMFQLSHARQAGLSVGLGKAGAPTPEGVPVFESTRQGWTINGQPVAGSDIVFRLSALSSRQNGIVIKYSNADPGDKLIQALNIVNQSGFSQVSLQSDDNLTTQ